MKKPSIAELLNASGYSTYTPELVQRAMFALYGHIGANLDERNWLGILQSPNPLEAAEAGLRAMYRRVLCQPNVPRADHRRPNDGRHGLLRLLLECEFAGSAVAFDGKDVVVKPVGVTETSSIAFGGNDIVVSV